MRISLHLADERDRERIYELRHQVYARELGQHAENGEGQLRDKLDEINTYLVARVAGAVVGFVSITPPGTVGYSIDKYFARRDVPLAFDQGLYEVRLLTVTRAHRGTRVALLLMHGALRYVEAHGGTRVVATGRVDLLDMYRHAGFTSLGLRVKSGEVTYELMTAEVRDLQAHRAVFTRPLTRLERLVDWQVPGLAFRGAEGCAHGGASFDSTNRWKRSRHRPSTS